jgi:peptidoglycan/LPS O-acetylase OafA/YrhL
LTPTEYIATARSGLAAVFSVSNIYFADTLSYFADGARTLPLLQTWSLGIEEQFYLVIPWALVLLARLDKRERLFAAIAAISLLSFIYNIFSSYLGFDERHAFYMPMSRFWEIGVGALVALMLREPGTLGRCELLQAVAAIA